MEIMGTFSRSGIPCLGVGGGAYSNTTVGRVVLRDGALPRALFVRSKGDLACSTEQAIVPVQHGDIVVSVRGSLPVDIGNPSLIIQAGRITALVGTPPEALTIGLEACEPPTLPDSVVAALSRYHNRDGGDFVA